MRELPIGQRTFDVCGKAIIAGLHEHRGYRFYTRYELARDCELFPGRDDLESVVVDHVDSAAT